MHWFLFLLLLATATLIFYQDLTTRSVLWYLFPAIALLGLVNNYAHTSSWTYTLVNCGVNGGFVLLQFVLLKTFYFIKTGERAIVNTRIGLGDILFLLASCCFFSPLNFLVFYCTSLLFVLVVYLIMMSVVKSKRNSTIPLAGYMAVFLLVYLGVFMIVHRSPAHDEWILNYLTVL
jgi:hypothetical protein